MSVLKLAPNFGQKSEVLFKLAVIFGKTYQLDQAINYFKLALVETAATTGANRRIDINIKTGICYMEKKEYAEALKFFENALSISDQNYLIYQHLAWCQFFMEKYSQALENVNKAIALKDTDGDGHYIKGRILLAKEMYNENKDANEVKDAFNRAISTDSAKAVYLGSLGILNCLIKSDTEAFENFLKATQLDSSIPETWFNIGLLYEAHDQSAEATVAYQKAIDVAPDFAPASVRRAAIASSTNTKSSLPQYIHPEFHVSDSMVPLKSYLNNQKIKKALEPGMMQVGQPQMMRNIFNESSLLPPEDGLKLTPAAVRVGEDDKENITETKFREEKKQSVKEKKKENVEEHLEIPLPVAQRQDKQENKPPVLEQNKSEHYSPKITQPVTMVTPQPSYITAPKIVRPAPTPVSSQPAMVSHPSAPIQVPSIHPSVVPQQQNPNQFDLSAQMQYGPPAQQPSLSAMGSMASVAQLAMSQMQQMPTAQAMTQTQQIPQGQPIPQMSSTGIPSNPHAIQGQLTLLHQFLQLLQQPQIQPYLPGLLNQLGSIVQTSSNYMVPNYHQNYMAPSKSPYPQNVPYASSAPSLPRPVQQVANEMPPQYQFSSMPRGPMPSYGIPGFPQMQRPDAPSLSMNLPRPSYSLNDQPQYVHQEQQQVQQLIQDAPNPTPIIPTRPIPQHPRVVPGLRPPAVRQPIRSDGRMTGRPGMLEELVKAAGMENAGLRSQGFQRAGQEYYGQEFDNKREDCGNVVKLAMSPQKIDEEFFAKRRKPENEMGREGMGSYEQANKRYKGDQNE
jgi:tetratricopeptide (TPR) repeat protein